MPPVTLYVLGERDWRARLSYPYGLPFQRSQGGLYPSLLAPAPSDSQKTSRELFYRGPHAGASPHGVVLALFLPLSYPERLLFRLREILLPLGPPPGDLEGFLDLNLGHEYAHAVQVAWRLRTGARWLDEFFANYLFRLGLEAHPHLVPLLLGWARYLARLEPKARSLSTYEGLGEALWFQARFTLKAQELWEKDRDRLLREFLAAAPLDRRRGHRLLLSLYPDLKGWFQGFAP